MRLPKTLSRHPFSTLFLGLSLYAFFCMGLASPCPAQGFVEGGYPRPILLDREQSTKAGGPVRIIDIAGHTWRIPQPEGFADIEHHTNETLPPWLLIPAINLWPGRVVFYSAPGNGSGASVPLPPFSLASMEIRTLEDAAQADRDKQEAPASPEGKAVDLTPVQLYLEGKGPMDGALWSELLRMTEEPGPDPELSFPLGKDTVTITVTQGSGDLPPEEYAAWEKRRNELEAAIPEIGANPTEKEIQALMDANDKYMEEFPPGSSPVSWHTAVLAGTNFTLGRYAVHIEMELGPALEPGILLQAVQRLQAWKEQILRLNK